VSIGKERPHVPLKKEPFQINVGESMERDEGVRETGPQNNESNLPN
jgi:hypothetical protein